jgi:2-dehydro-3-deoxyglucarate aldolase
MNRFKKITELRNKLRKGDHTIGSWMQIPHPSVAEIMGQAGFDWVAVDMEHGAICTHQLPDLFRALELGGTIPLVRLAEGRAKDCKQALDAGAGGVIVPMVESAQHLRSIHEACCWPPVGTRGVGFSRANLFGKFFSEYEDEARSPLLVAMIENIRAVDKLPEILAVNGLDAILIGPYDLSASMGVTAKFDDQDFLSAMNKIKRLSDEASLPCGLHIVQPSFTELNLKIKEGYRFLAYSIDAVFLYKGAQIRDEGI